MKKAFIVYGIALSLLLAYSNHYGWKITDSVSSGKWGPHGHSIYHK
jgi:hypothetical protein